MAKRERHALAAFLQGAGSTYLQGMQQRSEEQRQAREKWKECLFEGERTPDECLILSGYQPEEDEMHMAMSAREKGIERREGITRRAKLEEEGKEYTSLPIEKVAELGMPMREHISRATIRPEGTTIPMKREEVRLFKSLQPKEKRELTGEGRWLAEHPGKTHEDYLRATKGIEREFKKTEESHAKRVQSTVDDFNKALRKKVVEAGIIGKEVKREAKVELWQGWQGTIDPDILEDVARKLKMPPKEFLEIPERPDVLFTEPISSIEIPEEEKAQILREARKHFLNNPGVPFHGATSLKELKKDLGIF